MWLLNMEQMDGNRIMPGRNGREYRPPELAKYSVDVYGPEKNNLRVFWFLARAYLSTVLRC